MCLMTFLLLSELTTKVFANFYHGNQTLFESFFSPLQKWTFKQKFIRIFLVTIIDQLRVQSEILFV